MMPAKTCDQRRMMSNHMLRLIGDDVRVRTDARQGAGQGRRVKEELAARRNACCPTRPVFLHCSAVTTRKSSADQRLKEIRHVALDMDGTIYKGRTLFPFTNAFLARLTAAGIGYTFLTNNSSK